MPDELQRVVIDGIKQHLVDFSSAIRIDATQAEQRYAKRAKAKPRWSRTKVVKFVVARPANRAAALAAGAGGLAFAPGIGAAAAAAAIAASTLDLFSHCIEASDIVASSHGFSLDDDINRLAARLSVVVRTIPARVRPNLLPPPPLNASVLLTMSEGSKESLLKHEEDVLRAWAIGVSSWRLAAMAPVGIGAFAGAWAGYLPVKFTAAQAERFFAPSPAAEIVALADDESDEMPNDESES